MATIHPELSSHLLIDGAMVTHIESIVPVSGSERPGWMHSIYNDDIAQYSPLVIDVQAAVEAGQIDVLMQLVNARRPQLHLSIIDTTWAAADLAQHLRHFIFVRIESGEETTFRFADCTVLFELPNYLSDAQWSTFRQPASRWLVHQRDGTLATLPPSIPTATLIATPMRLSNAQVEALREAKMPDRMIMRVLEMRAIDDLPGTSAEQYAWAFAAYKYWREAGDTRILLLETLTEVAIETRGIVLQKRGLADLMAKDELNEIQDGLELMQMQILSPEKYIQQMERMK